MPSRHCDFVVYAEVRILFEPEVLGLRLYVTHPIRLFCSHYYYSPETKVTLAQER